MNSHPLLTSAKIVISYCCQVKIQSRFSFYLLVEELPFNCFDVGREGRLLWQYSRYMFVTQIPYSRSDWEYQRSDISPLLIVALMRKESVNLWKQRRTICIKSKHYSTQMILYTIEKASNGNSDTLYVRSWISGKLQTCRSILYDGIDQKPMDSTLSYK